MSKISEANLVIDAFQYWNKERLSREQLLEILIMIGKTPRGRRMLEQIRDLLWQALEQNHS